jgi:hypothetical protein
MTVWRGWSRVGVLLSWLVAAAAQAAGQVAVIEHRGARYGEVVFSAEADADGRRTREEARIDVSGNGSRETLVFEQRSAEDSDGRPRWLWRRESAGPQQQRFEVTRVDGRVHWQRRDGRQQARLLLAPPPDWLVDAGLVRRIAAQPAAPWSFDYTELDLARARFRAVRLSSTGLAVDGVLELTRESEGGRERQYWSVAQQRLLPRWNLAGLSLSSRACSGDCGEVPRQYLDLLAPLTLASPYRFPAAARRETLRYVFETDDGAALLLPATGEQRVVQRGTRAVVTICSDCGDEAPPDAATLARYRRANAWVQSDNAEIIALARSAPAIGSMTARMHRLEQVVYLHMNGPRAVLGYASALQALHSRSGDCTEFALLLAALARAVGLPARVVSGIAYASDFAGKPDAFSPHAWVQVWDGRRWISFDAGLGDVESTHIALAVGDGSPEDYAGVGALLRRLRLVDAGQVEAAK